MKCRFILFLFFHHKLDPIFIFIRFLFFLLALSLFYFPFSLLLSLSLSLTIPSILLFNPSPFIIYISPPKFLSCYLFAIYKQEFIGRRFIIPLLFPLPHLYNFPTKNVFTASYFFMNNSIPLILLPKLSHILYPFFMDSVSV